MKKRTLAKLGGFAIAAATTAALVGFAANGTGAYFTASSDGNANVSTGAVTVHTTDITALNFNGLLPGVYGTQSFQYNTNGGTGLEDVYLEIPANNYLQHIPTSGSFPLGRYGHFAASGPDGSFSSFNLAAAPGLPSTPNPTDCVVDQYGRGGNQTTAATSLADFSNGFCPVPQFILLGYGVASGDPNATASITFGFTGLLTAPQSTTMAPIPFKVVATQHGILPNDPNNAPFV